MTNSATPHPQDWREGRRRRAWDLYQAGWPQIKIAAALGVSPAAVSQWLTRAVRDGVDSLRRRVASGRPPRLSTAQRAQLPALLERGAETYGFRGAVWTSTRVATLIEREFGVRYHPSHVSRLLRQIGWTVQKPIRRASQRDEAAIAAWKDDGWPALKKRRRPTAARSSG